MKLWQAVFTLGSFSIGVLGCADKDGDHPPFVCDNCSGGAPANAGRGGFGSSGSGGLAGAGGSGGAAGGSAWFTDYDCSDTNPCSIGTCIEIWPGGFKTCSVPAEPAEACTGNPDDECCTTADCETGVCLASDDFTAAAKPPPNFNLCAVPPCLSDDDCLNEDACLPSGLLGRPLGGCISAMCRTDADCTEYPGGVCAPVENACFGTYLLVTCIYPEGACRRNSDCSVEVPPFGPGEPFCDNGFCTEVLSGTFCAD